MESFVKLRSLARHSIRRSLAKLFPSRSTVPSAADFINPIQS